MLFWLVPSARVRFSSAAVGAIATTALFTLVRYAFGIYADFLFHGKFNLIYGSVGLAIIFLISIQVLWVVILLGVEISYVYQNVYGMLRASEQQIEDEPMHDLYFALCSLIEIARRFDKREEAPSSYRLAAQFGTTDAQMLRVLRRLEDAQLVKEIGGEWAGFVPGCDPDRISVEEVIQQIEGSRRAVPAVVKPDSGERNAINALFTRLSDNTRSTLDQMTIGRLVRELQVQRPTVVLDERRRER
jgi:membrane protein